MFITALFIIARTWKQPRCPSADEWIRKQWFIYTMEYYSAIKKNTFESIFESFLLDASQISEIIGWDSGPGGWTWTWNLISCVQKQSEDTEVRCHTQLRTKDSCSVLQGGRKWEQLLLPGIFVSKIVVMGLAILFCSTFPYFIVTYVTILPLIDIFPFW